VHKFSVDSHTHVIVFVPAPRAYGKDGYSEEMEQLLESMEAANISPSRKVFMEVADIYGLSTNVIKSVTKQPIHKKPELAADANSMMQLQNPWKLVQG
jgi:pentatricopeptide repeat protein